MPSSGDRAVATRLVTGTESVDGPALVTEASGLCDPDDPSALIVGS